MNWETVSEIFKQATERSGIEQERYLRHISEQHPEEYAEVLSLLAEDESLHPIFAIETTNLWDTIYDLAWEGKVIGNYQLLSHLGSGGMGAVLLAKRADGEFDQTVALKVLRPGKWSEKLIQRFREERQILASLQHPNIARLLDGGVTETGSPYFTMEYIDGEPITDYCFDNKLNISEKLQLIQQVCQAIDYAHQNLIVHLDLKPSNILVNAEGQVKLLDFGIAQALQDTEKAGAQFFTKNYASPEQLRQERLTTASDIYSLGLIFKELLLENSADFYDLNVSFSDDLKAIFLKSTAEKPGERYAAASEMASDITAYLNNYPVSAQQRTAGYLLRKGFRRNKLIISALGIAFFTIIGLTIFYTSRLQSEKRIAEREAARANQISDYLISIFTLANPDETPISEFTVEQLLAASTENLQEKLQDQPEVLSDIYQVLSSVYQGLNLYETADSLAQLSLDLKFQLYKPPHEAIINGLVNTANIDLDAGYFEKGDSLLQLAYQMTLQLPGNQELSIAKRQYDLGMLAFHNLDFLQADSFFTIVYPVFKKHYEPPKMELANILHNLGTTHRRLGYFESAEKYLLQSLQMKQQLYKPPHAEIAYTLNHIASLYLNQEAYTKAIPYAQASLQQRRQVFGDANDETLASQANLARIYRHKGDLDSARMLYTDAIEKYEKAQGETHHNLAGLLSSLAGVYFDQRDFPQAESYARRAYQIGAQLLPATHPTLAVLAERFGLMLYHQSKYAEAVPYLQKTIDIRKQNNLPDKTSIALPQYHLGACLWQLKRTAEARPLLEVATKTLSENPEKFSAELQEIKEMLK